ncbi:uncharacterized protein EV154DRAFT_606986 [Mucor mucedo]|uniref:uncharacterized protein n=1 Tax=Mucor mucedo TaxID=29922 RepID=UPI00221F14D1|nr:uncharacterized protein EV154DRAFT_606986 [Mucor mucedo]KAI7874254.1 hypothetical protein EV154DRAFT_606986 [Mucor mucedo]
MIKDTRKFHSTNYYEYKEVQYKLITRYTDVLDTYHSRIATITIILDFLHLFIPSNVKKDYDAKRVVPMLVGIDVEDMPETLAVGESNEKHKDELKKLLFTKSNNLGTCRRIIMAKLIIKLLHRCFAANDYTYASVRSNCISFLSQVDFHLICKTFRFPVKNPLNF